MTEVSSRNLQIRLLVLVFLAFIPALGFYWYADRELRSLQMKAHEQELVRRAVVAAAEYRTLAEDSRAYLATLAEIPEIRNARFPACDDYLTRFLSHAPTYTTLTVVGMDGNLACGGLSPEGGLYLGDREYFVRATSRRAFSVGEFGLGRITGKPVVGVALPVIEGGMPVRVVAASIDLSRLGTRMDREPLPEGYTFTVVGRNGRVMVRVPTTGDFTLADSVGSAAEGGFPAFPDGTQPLVMAGTDLDGIERLFAVAPLRGPSGQAQGYVAVGRTRATVLEEADQVASFELRYLAVGALALLVLAYVLGHVWLARCPPEAEEG